MKVKNREAFMRMVKRDGVLSAELEAELDRAPSTPARQPAVDVTPIVNALDASSTRIERAIAENCQPYPAPRWTVNVIRNAAKEIESLELIPKYDD